MSEKICPAAKQPSGRKQRTREHVIADLGVNFVERVVLLCGYTFTRTSHDDGIDGVIETFDHRGGYELGMIKVQLKSVESVATTADGQAVWHRVAVADLRSWLFDIMPVLLTACEIPSESAYWLDVQEYARTADLDIVNAATQTLRIPTSNTWTQEVVRTMRTVINRIVEQTVGRWDDEG